VSCIPGSMRDLEFILVFDHNKEAIQTPNWLSSVFPGGIQRLEGQLHEEMVAS